jgi:hypothetical protein
MELQAQLDQLVQLDPLAQLDHRQQCLLNQQLVQLDLLHQGLSLFLMETL